MSYLLDTNVVSALRVPARHPEVATWAASIPLTHLYVSALTIAEIERGVVKREQSDPPQGALLRRWFDGQVLPALERRVVPFDLAAARALATFRVPERAPLDDALIAATAQAGGFTLATRNVKHFAPLGIPTVNPWD